jgi:hypothetical protein
MPTNFDGGSELNGAVRSATTRIKTGRTAKHWWVWFTVAALAALAAACTGHTSGAPSSQAQSVPVTPTGTSIPTESATATGDPRVIVDTLNAAGLALCHSVPSDGVDALSCVATNQPNTGVIEVDVYPSATDASAALRQVGQIWLDAWLYGNIAILVDQTTPLPIAQEVSGILGHLPGTTQFRLMAADSTIKSLGRSG